MSNVVSLPESFYDRLRADGHEAGNAFEAMQTRFPAFNGIPAEVAHYREVMVAAYLEYLDGRPYFPADAASLSVTETLTEQGAFTHSAAGYWLSSEGVEVAKGLTLQRYAHLLKDEAEDEDVPSQTSERELRAREEIEPTRGSPLWLGYNFEHDAVAAIAPPTTEGWKPSDTPQWVWNVLLALAAYLALRYL